MYDSLALCLTDRSFLTRVALGGGGSSQDLVGGATGVSGKGRLSRPEEYGEETPYVPPRPPRFPEQEQQHRPQQKLLIDQATITDNALEEWHAWLKLAQQGRSLREWGLTSSDVITAVEYLGEAPPQEEPARGGRWTNAPRGGGRKKQKPQQENPTSVGTLLYLKKALKCIDCFDGSPSGYRGLLLGPSSAIGLEKPDGSTASDEREAWKYLAASVALRVQRLLDKKRAKNRMVDAMTAIWLQTPKAAAAKPRPVNQCSRGRRPRLPRKARTPLRRVYPKFRASRSSKGKELPSRSVSSAPLGQKRCGSPGSLPGCLEHRRCRLGCFQRLVLQQLWEKRVPETPPLRTQQEQPRAHRRWHRPRRRPHRRWHRPRRRQQNRRARRAWHQLFTGRGGWWQRRFWRRMVRRYHCLQGYHLDMFCHNLHRRHRRARLRSPRKILWCHQKGKRNRKGSLLSPRLWAQHLPRLWAPPLPKPEPNSPTTRPWSRPRKRPWSAPVATCEQLRRVVFEEEKNLL